jgi:type II secretory pathway pseudopilin PulG
MEGGGDGLADRLRQRLADQSGVTLMEVLASATILVVAITSALAILFVGERSSRSQVAWSDQAQQLRAAIKQMADDLAYAQWETSSICRFYQPTAALAYQPVTSRTGAAWAGLPDWPGDLTDWPAICIQYELANDALIRQAFDRNDVYKVYSRRAVVTGLIPAGEENGSILEVDTTNRLITVVLRAPRQGGGPSDVVEVATQFHMR